MPLRKSASRKKSYRSSPCNVRRRKRFSFNNPTELREEFEKKIKCIKNKLKKRWDTDRLGGIDFEALLNLMFEIAGTNSKFFGRERGEGGTRNLANGYKSVFEKRRKKYLDEANKWLDILRITTADHRKLHELVDGQ